MTPEEWLAKALWRDQWDYDGGRLEAAPSGFIVCDECEGKGALVVQSSRGPLATDDVPCSKCRGSGLCPTAAIQSIAEELFGDPVLWRQASPRVQRAYTKVARGIIRALNYDGYEIVRRDDLYRPIAGVDDTPQEAG